MKKIFIPLAGGLGNQFFQLATALSLTDKEVIVLSCLGNPRSHNGLPDIQEFSLPPRVLFWKCTSKHFVACKFFSLAISSTSRRSWLVKNRLLGWITEITISFVMSFHLRQFVVMRIGSGIGFDSMLAAKRGNFLTGYFQSYRYVESEVKKSELMGIKCTSNDPTFQDLFQKSRTQKPILIHVRLGDYKQDPVFGILGEDYFKTAISLITKISTARAIWLFSDEPKSAIDLLPEAIRGEIYVVPNELTPAETFDIMRNCSDFVISNSTFSWWAAYLARNTAAKVLYPDPWFSGKITPNEMSPPDWITIPR